jgi:HD-GYP domain-containing protein (c-di-GMP phosphodiesterase class II)
MVNDLPFVEKGVHIANFIRRLRKKKIDRVVFRKTPDLEEMTGFIIGMASREKVTSTAHVSVGIVEVRLRSGEATPAALLDGGISKVRETFLGVSRCRELDMIGLEDAVIDFLAVLKKELNVLSIVSPVKTHNEYTYVHATNVSVLSIFQAEVLGFTGEALRDIGLAGLLHDVGKIFVTNSILDKQGKLDENEWDDMKKHPVYGALYLSKLSVASPLAAIVAFEHHMKFNGSGYPDTKRIGKKQHIVSQIVAIADFFDALRTERPYRKTLEVPLIAKMMLEGAGKDFNPALVGSFLSSLAEVTGGEL